MSSIIISDYLSICTNFLSLESWIGYHRYIKSFNINIYIIYISKIIKLKKIYIYRQKEELCSPVL